MTTPTPDAGGLDRELARLIAGQVFLHACMAGMRLAAPLLALREGYSAAAVGVLLALFALTQVFLALPAGRYRRPARPASGPLALARGRGHAGRRRWPRRSRSSRCCAWRRC